MKHFFPLSLLLASSALTPALAQGLTNNGATITVSGGAILTVQGSLTNNSGTVDMSNGANSLNVSGNLVNASGATLTPGVFSTVTLNGTAAQQLDLKGASLANLTIDNASGVSLPANSTADVSGALTLSSGMLATAPNATLRLVNGATLSGEQNGRYVQGNLAAVKANVPAGAATAFPNGFTLTPTTSATNLTVTRRAGLNTPQLSYGTSASGENKGIDRIWQTSQAVSGQVVLSWLLDNDNGLTGSLAQSQVWALPFAPVAGSGWYRIGNTQNGTGRSAVGTTPAGTPYSYFTVGTAAAPLPVTLVAFEAQRSGDAARLTWRTASELRNDHFEVEMSIDGQTFRRVGEHVPGRGTTTSPSDYSFLDPKLLHYAASLVYYRLRQVDTDGKDSYSPVRTIRVEDAATFAVAAFPNPHGEAGTRLQVRTAQAGPLTLTAYDATGRVVFARTAELPTGTTALDLPEAGRLPTGVYFVKATQASQSTVLKLARE